MTYLKDNYEVPVLLAVTRAKSRTFPGEFFTVSRIIIIYAKGKRMGRNVKGCLSHSGIWEARIFL